MATDPLPPPQAPRRLTRSSTNRYLGGVAGGLGRYFGVDPILFRVAFGVSIVFGGLGPLAYCVLLAVLRRDDGSPAFMEDRSRAFTVAATIVLAIAAIGALRPPSVFLGPGLLVVAALSGGAVLLYKRLGGDRGDDPARMVARAMLVIIALVATLGAATGIGLIAALGGGVAVAAIAVAAGLGLIAAGLLGGPRWLILPVMVLVLPLAVVTAAGVDLRGGVGERTYRPATVADLRPEYRIGAGRLSLDLRGMDVPAGRTDVRVKVGLGEALVRVPEGTCVATDARIGAGRADLPDHPRDEGLDVKIAAPSSADRFLHVTADIGAGHLQIEGACA